MSDDWFQAAEHGNIEVLIEHLDHGKEINERGDGADYRGVTALMLAVDGGRVHAIELLLRRGANVDVESNIGWTAMTFASLRTAGGNVRPPPNWPARRPDRRPVELLAAAGGRFGLRESVLMGDVSLARRLCDAEPAIDVSGGAGFCSDVRLLIERGADIHAVGLDYLTPLKWALKRGHAAIADQLERAGACR